MEAHGIACAADGRASAGYGGIAALVLFGDFAQDAAGNARGEYACRDVPFHHAIPTAGTIFIFYVNNGAIAIDGNANILQCELDPNGSSLFYMTINPL